ncbi:hypothetical protein [Flavobacterium aquiphilum]|uniref:hypothetical protein n=1 Tax=Flavobacterium aquiphilum TaxID=3003261 RepID=UPI002480B677|nr:hypothetical protein [Flavobacterium aquiphilum]
MSPENPANIYDLAGKLHNEILDVYLTGNYTYTTIAEINQQIEAISASNGDLTLLNSQPSQPVNLVEMQDIVDNPQAKLEEVISNSTMTNEAKTSLSNFMNDVLLWENVPYEEIYQSIISYESSVMDNVVFTDEDKRIILTTSSITRYSLYYDEERKDKDWGSSVGNRVGGVSGAIENSSEAVKCSLIIGIMINSLGAN